MTDRAGLLPERWKAAIQWLGWTMLVLVVAFVMGEQLESGRLGAVAACESAKDASVCVRQRGYLLQSPYYPDISRRVVGGWARLVGGTLGASYAPAPALDEE